MSTTHSDIVHHGPHIRPNLRRRGPREDATAGACPNEHTEGGVYADGQEMQVDDGYTRQARDPAETGADIPQQKVDSQEASKLERLPMGVHALCDSKEGDPRTFLQLAISRVGTIAGSYPNTQTNESPSVQGGTGRESTRLFGASRPAARWEYGLSAA